MEKDTLEDQQKDEHVSLFDDVRDQFVSYLTIDDTTIKFPPSIHT
jgi:hypothetical protein